MWTTRPPRGAIAAADENLLDSWKEIARYLGRAVRTVQTWEKQEGLPVHRHRHRKGSTVYAFASEIDTWRQERDAPARGGPSFDGQPRVRPWLPAVVTVILATAAFLLL